MYSSIVFLELRNHVSNSAEPRQKKTPQEAAFSNRLMLRCGIN
jgi:hypothetical protein